MKHMQSDKQTIAWFKIAECVSRGEKERALGVYRLLSHSFNDDAVALQLEADIYLSFDEQNKAIDLYRDAIKAYKRTGRFLEAVAVCEHLLTLSPHDVVLRKEAMQLFKNSGIASKVTHHIFYLVNYYVQKNQRDEVKKTLEECEALLDPVGRVATYQHAISILQEKNNYSSLVMWCLEKAVDELVVNGKEREMQEFLSTVKALDDSLHEHAVTYLKKI